MYVIKTSEGYLTKKSFKSRFSFIDSLDFAIVMDSIKEAEMTIRINDIENAEIIQL